MSKKKNESANLSVKDKTKNAIAESVRNVIQSISRAESLVITDPKARIYSKTAEFAFSKGYRVSVL